MTLSDYLAAHKLSDASFGAAIGVKRQSVFRYRRGIRRPQWDVLATIARVTKGQVTANDFADPSDAYHASPTKAVTAPLQPAANAEAGP